jgi:hypothetical protein
MVKDEQVAEQHREDKSCKNPTPPRHWTRPDDPTLQRQVSTPTHSDDVSLRL